eukprot:TRINITY_DN5547_c0_g2_i5.p1 TRINITY_DN5547_c0_g2~~TRINITY_DN5547_c0_g2_i5.p1  ORF type:complete len:316 (-),score=45.48 TRINITY_DN5547_c0_g2_i5:300-1247(-)
MRGSNKNPLGTTRNLTEQFVKYRTNARSSKVGLTSRAGELQLQPISDIAEKGDVGVYMELTPQWMQNADAVKSGLKKLKQMISELRTLHSQGGLVSFSEEQEGSAQDKITQKTNQIKQYIKNLDKMIQTIDQGVGGQDQDSKIVIQVRKQLAGGLLQLSHAFQREEMKYLDKRKGNQDASSSSFSFQATDDNGTSSSNELSQIDVFQQQLFIQKQIDAQVDMIEQRDAEIMYVVETITELSQIMKDLAMVVQEQGTVLDRIDYNIEQVAASVEAGVEQLVRAQKSQKASQMTWCIICLACAVFIMLLVLIARRAT